MSLHPTDSKEIRRFGLIALIFFGSLCALGVWREKPIPTYLFGFLAVLGFGFILTPSRLRPIYSAWLKIAHLLGRVVTILVLTLVYYMVLTPTALIKRLFSGLPIPIRPDKDISSYWVTRAEPAQSRDRFFKRY